MVSLGRIARIGLLVVCTAATARAQSGGSPYVPLDDPAYRFIDALVARGALRGLPALERPYTTDMIRRAIQPADTGSAAGRVTRGWTLRLLGSLARLDARSAQLDSADAVWSQVDASFGIVAQSSGRRNLMLADSSSGVFPSATLRGVAIAGPVVATARLFADNRVADDPEYFGKSDRWVRGRLEDGYVSAQWPAGEIFFGRQSRNWGPPSLQGFQVGTAAYSYDHLYARLGPSRAHIATILTRLNDGASLTASDLARADRSPTGLAAHRYFAVHRLAFRVRDIEVAGSESYLYSGVGRAFSFAIANPLNLYNLSQYNDNELGNVAYSLEVAGRSRLGLLSGQFFLDDFQVDSCSPACSEPSSYGLTLSADGVPLMDAHRLFGSYTRVTALAYRTPDPTETYASFNASLGRDAVDYDELRGGVDLALVPVAVTRIYAAHRRQGAANFRQPFPLPAQYAATKGFLTAPVTRVDRVALDVAMGPASGVRFSGDLGVNRTCLSACTWQPEGRIRIEWTPLTTLASGWIR